MVCKKGALLDPKVNFNIELSELDGDFGSIIITLQSGIHSCTLKGSVINPFTSDMEYLLDVVFFSVSDYLRENKDIVNFISEKHKALGLSAIVVEDRLGLSFNIGGNDIFLEDVNIERDFELKPVLDD